MTDVRLIRWRRHERGLVIGTCPECDKEGTFAPNHHRVEKDGSVIPSFICPGCGWHGWVQLKDWIAP